MITSERMWLDYRRELLRFISSRVKDRETAEDIVHDVFVKAYSHRNELNDVRRLRAWLYQITRNAVIDHYRKARPLEALPDDLVAESADPTVNAEKALAGCLRPLLRGLPAAYGQALSMADLEGVKQSVIAEQLGLSLSGAKSRVQRARRMLKDALLACCEVELDHKSRPSDPDLSESCNQCCSGG